MNRPRRPIPRDPWDMEAAATPYEFPINQTTAQGAPAFQQAADAAKGLLNDLGRYSSNYDLRGNPFDQEGRQVLRNTLVQAPLGGYMRSMVENMGGDTTLGRRIERGTAGALSAGVGLAALASAYQGLTQSNQQSPGTLRME